MPQPSAWSDPVLLAFRLVAALRAALTAAVATVMSASALGPWRRLRERRLDGARRLEAPVSAALVGGKAARLAALAARGFPVPPALVLDADCIARLAAATPVERRQRAQRLAAAIGGQAFAVRSSAVTEDGACHSFAGVFASEMPVPAHDLPAAIARVAASASADRARGYAQASVRAQVIVQRLVKAEFAGVLFTRAPDADGQMLVEYVDGPGDALTSGRRTPLAFRFGRLTHLPIGVVPSINLAPLLDLGERIAALFGAPQDIEWAFADGQFHILQARDIADAADDHVALDDMPRLIGAAAAHRPATRLRPGTILYHRAAMADALPRPTTTSLDLLNALWGRAGSLERAAARLDLAYRAPQPSRPLFLLINGRLVADAAVDASCAVTPSARDRRRLSAAAPAIASEIRAALPVLRREESLTAALDLQRLAFADLATHVADTRRRFVTRVHPLVDTVTMLIGLRDADRANARCGDVAVPLLCQPAWHAAIIAAAPLDTRARTDAWQRIAGHRSNLDLELAHPRWGEIPGAVDAFAVTLRAEASVTPAPGALEDLALLREDIRHEMLRAFANLRRALVELDRRAGLGGHIFELTLDEICGLQPELFAAAQVMTRRRRQARLQRLAEPPPPVKITAGDLERAAWKPALSLDSAAASQHRSSTRCQGRGTRVSGRGEMTGRVYVASEAQATAGLPLADFREADILVAPLLHPDWLSIVLRSGGVVTDTGSWLSHMAIIAREHAIPMIVGIPNAGQFRTGDRVRLMPDGRVMAEPDPIPRLTLVASN